MPIIVAINKIDKDNADVVSRCILQIVNLFVVEMNENKS